MKTVTFVLGVALAASLVWVLLLARASDARPSEVERSQTQVERFKRLTGYPHGREGYVVDHLVPLACGGPDHPLNMQWQTVEEGKAKDRVELDCARYCRPFNQRVR